LNDLSSDRGLVSLQWQLLLQVFSYRTPISSVGY
jgi:hypothetical protein